MSLSDQSVVVAAKDQVSCDLGGEAAILNTKNGTYYGLDPVGAHIWKLVQAPLRVSQIRESVLQTYQVEAERCGRDIVSLLERLLAEGLIVERDDVRL